MGRITDIKDVKTSIINWENTRNEVGGLSYLKAGFGFRIKRSEYLNWKSIPNSIENIHVYIGISDNDKTTFILVDSDTDQKGQNNNESVYKIGTNLFIKGFDNELRTVTDNKVKSLLSSSFKIQGTGLTTEEVLARILNWQFYGNDWFEKQRKSDFFQPIKKGNGQSEFFAGVFKCITIPFMDLTNIFELSSSIDELFAFFALRKDLSNDSPIKREVVELILCNENVLDGSNIGMEIYMDVTMPRPPFSAASGFNLF